MFSTFMKFLFLIFKDVYLLIRPIIIDCSENYKNTSRSVKNSIHLLLIAVSFCIYLITWAGTAPNNIPNIIYFICIILILPSIIAVIYYIITSTLFCIELIIIAIKYIWGYFSKKWVEAKNIKKTT